jgi:hypothetical protein
MLCIIYFSSYIFYVYFVAGGKPKILVLNLFCYLGTEVRSRRKFEASFCAGTSDGLALAK